MARLLTTAFIALFIAFSLPGEANPIKVGDSYASVIDTLGSPMRQERSTHGKLLVYRDSLVFFVGDKVDFVSFGLSIEPADAAAETATEIGDETGAIDDSDASASETAANADMAASPKPKARGQILDEEAFEDHPGLSEAVRQNQANLLSASQTSANLNAYWGQLRHQFARNSIFNSPDGADGMIKIKTADGRLIPAVGETGKPSWGYLDVGVDDALESSADAEATNDDPAVR